MSPHVDTLGLIAGSQNLPMALARQARLLGVKRIVAVAVEGETRPELAGLVDEIVWLRVGQLSRMISAFVKRGVRQCVMAGQVAPRNLFDLRPDLRALRLLLRLKERNAHTLFGAIAEELHKEGVELVEATPWLRPLMPRAGFQAGPRLSTSQRADVAYGFRLAKEVSRLDIGQLVVVRDGTALAVEGFEGTDACLRRGGELAGRRGGAVAVKVTKADHDMRFDIPCLGVETLQACVQARIAVLAFEAEKTLLLDEEPVKQLARSHKIALLSTTGE